MEALIFTLIGLALAGLAFWSRTRFADFLSQRPDDYAKTPGDMFDLRAHLNGRMVCEGAIYGPLGRVSSTFVGYFDCAWDGNQGRMDETFHYNDGTQQDRSWALTLGNDGRIKATASDVEGVGSGVQCGNSVQLRYRFRLPDSAGGHVLNVTDWMYLAPNGSIVNRSQFRKFGIRVAELVATMRPIEQEIAHAA